MDFSFTDDQKALRVLARELMDTHGSLEYIRKLDATQSYPYELYQQWIESGLLSVPFPEEYGGIGGSVTDMTIITEEIARSSGDLQMAFGASTFCGLNIVRKGTEEQKQYWLPKLLDGSVKMAISISESDAGSDVGSMRTRAVRDGDHYVINGTKLWTTGGGAEGAVLNVYCITDATVRYNKGMSLILVENNAPGVKLRKLDMLGRRCTGTYEINFENVRVPIDRCIGGENNGWDCILGGLQIERVVSTAGNCGSAQACVDLAVGYSRERVQFGHPIGTNQAIAHMLADIQTEVDAARVLMWRAAWMVDQKMDALREISMAKLMSSETYVKAANLGMQVFGGYGYNMEYDMQRHYRDCRSTTIAAGSSQMQRNIIANKLGLKIN